MIDMVCAILGVDVNRFLEDTQPYMTTDQVRQLSRDGFQIGAHGRNHQRLDRLTEQQVREEIIGSCSDVRAITNQDTVPFAFPHSSGTLDRVFLTILASEFRFIGMMLDSNGVAKDAPRILHRVCLDSRDSGLHRHSNAARHFRDAFQRQAATNISRLGRTLSRR
jgi:peptidoglycan/xylan/chitin deacetylase (PgdA/CDA1 family)